jgi:lipoate-protein ligase A
VCLVKRQAGGTSVFASAGVLGLDIALPACHGLVSSDVVEGYRWLGEVWTFALQDLGVATRLVSIEEARATTPPEDDVADALRAACFGTLSPYEVLSNGRKLVGLAQVRRRAGVLLQSGVHRHFDGDTLARLLRPGDPSTLAQALQKVAVGLDELDVDVPTTSKVMSAFGKCLEQHQNVRLRDGEWTRDEIDLADAYVAQSAPMEALGQG